MNATQARALTISIGNYYLQVGKVIRKTEKVNEVIKWLQEALELPAKPPVGRDSKKTRSTGK